MRSPPKARPVPKSIFNVNGRSKGLFTPRPGDIIYRGVGVIDDPDGVMCYHDHVKPGTMMAVSCPCPKCSVTA